MTVTRRQIQSTINDVISDSVYSDSRIIGPTGLTSYNRQDPTGPVLIQCEQFDRVERWTNPATTNVNVADFVSVPLVRTAGVNYEHSGPAPTIATLNINAFDLSNRSGSHRIWVVATGDLRNGVFVEVTRVTDLPDGPAVVSNLSETILVTQLNPASVATDPGYNNLFSAFPSINNAVSFQHRPLRLRAGYVVDGNETISVDFYSVCGSFQGGVFELAASPSDGEYGDHQLATYAASVCFSYLPSVAGFASFTPNNETRCFTFDVAGEAIATTAFPLFKRTTFLQVIHSPVSILQEGSASQSISYAPMRFASVRACTAVRNGYTVASPDLTNNPTGVVPLNLRYGIASFAGSQRICRPYVGSEFENVPNVADDHAFAVKDGPSWHENSLVPIGTAASVNRQRQALTVVFPAYADTGTIVSGVSNGRATLAAIDSALIRRMISGRALTIAPSIGDRLLIPGEYYAAAALPQRVFSLEPANPTAGYSFSVDMFLTVSAGSRQRLDPALNTPTWTATNPWPSLADALAAGVDEEYYFALQTASLNRSSSNVAWTGGILSFACRAAAKYQFTRLGTLAVDVTRYKSLGFSFELSISAAQCVDLGNGGTVNATISGFLADSGLTAQLSLA
jgi:hypothetical protein